jgi:hypothetical protein
MMDFIKVILLVALFYVLIIFSFFWLNTRDEDRQRIPYIKNFFERISDGSGFWERNPLEGLNLERYLPSDNKSLNIFMPEKDDY